MQLTVNNIPITLTEPQKDSAILNSGETIIYKIVKSNGTSKVYNSHSRAHNAFNALLQQDPETTMMEIVDLGKLGQACWYLHDTDGEHFVASKGTINSSCGGRMARVYPSLFPTVKWSRYLSPILDKESEENRRLREQRVLEDRMRKEDPSFLPWLLCGLMVSYGGPLKKPYLSV